MLRNGKQFLQPSREATEEEFGIFFEPIRCFAISPTSRWRSLGGPGWSRTLGTTTSGNPSYPSATVEASCEGSIRDPHLTAAAASAATGRSPEHSVDGDGRVKYFLADQDRDGTVREGDEGSRLAEKRGVHPIFPSMPPMPPIQPAPRSISRTIETDTPPSVPGAALGELEQDSVCDGIPLPLLPNHISTALIGTTAHSPPLGPRHRSKEEEQPRIGSWRTAGEFQNQDDLAITRGRLDDISALSPFLPLFTEEDEESEQEQQEHQEHEQEPEQQHEQDESAQAESNDGGKHKVGGHGRETSIVRKIGDVVPSEQTALHAGGARVSLFAEESADERAPAPNDKQESEEEREEGITGHGEEGRRALYIADREKETFASFLIPADGAARNNQLQLGGVENDGLATEKEHGEERPVSSRVTANNEEAADGFCRKDTAPSRGEDAGGGNDRDEDPGTGAERKAAKREEEESDSSYRRDCAVLAGTAKIVFALLALEHRGMSSRFYRWKRTRHRQQKGHRNVVRANGKNPFPDNKGGH